MRGKYLPHLRIRGSALLWRIRSSLWDRPIYRHFIRIWKLFRPGLLKNCLVDLDTEIVIEGFPRSSNTFAVHAFLLSQDRPVKVAHHLHDGYQIAYAVDNDIPCLVLIRSPEGSVASWLLKSPQMKSREILKLYIRFHELVLKYIDYVIVARYEDVTSDFGSVITRLNDKYGLNFNSFEHTPENLDKVFGRISENWDSRVEKSGQPVELSVSFPTQQKQEAKKSVLKRIYEEDADLLRQAQQIYDELVRSTGATQCGSLEGG